MVQKDWFFPHLSPSYSFSRFLLHILPERGLGGGIHTVPFDSGICRYSPTPLQVFCILDAPHEDPPEA
jgi:hypothetical protein